MTATLNTTNLAPDPAMTSLRTRLTITLFTRLHHGISGGGRTYPVRTWSAGPINAQRADKALRAERVENRECYGNIGCGQSWLTLQDGTVAYVLGEADIAHEVQTATTIGLPAMVDRRAKHEQQQAAEDAAHDALSASAAAAYDAHYRVASLNCIIR